MKKANRFLSILLTFCMVLGMIPGTAFAADADQTFTDVKKSDWYYDAAQYVYENGMMNGTGEKTFSPESTMTRGMIVTILHRLEGEPVAVGAEFSDVPLGRYYTAAVDWASANGIVGGYGNGTFGPDDIITREQMSAILYRYAQYKDYDTETAGDISTFADGKKVSTYAIDAMNWAVGSGLISGIGFNRIAPQDAATRAQAAVILMRFCNSVADATLEVYTVTLIHEDGTEETFTVKHGETIDRPSNPSKKGHSFKGWYLDGKKFDFNSAITEDITLYPEWREIIEDEDDDWEDDDQEDVVTPTPTPTPDIYYTVNFDANGGSTTIDFTKVGEGSSIGALPEASWEGFTFLGWYTSAFGGSKITTSTAITRDMTVYAHWITAEIGTGSYHVTFDRNDGSAGVYQTQWVDAGQLAIEPEAPERDLYRFTGWYLEPAGVTAYDFDTQIVSDLILYAGWGNPDGSDDMLYAASSETETIFSLSDIYVEGNEVTVTYNTNDVALINVEFFEDLMEEGEWDEDKLNANLAQDPISVTSGYTENYGELATITLPVEDDLPEYFLVRATMADSHSNTAEYVTAKYTETFAAFDALNVDDFAPERVINFDGESNTNFGVIKESVIVIPIMCQYGNGGEFYVEEIETAEDDLDEAQMEDLVPDFLYTFPDKNAVISTDDQGNSFTLNDLSAGDVIYIEGTTRMFKIKTIEVHADGSITFTEDSDVTMLDFYDTLKVDFEGLEAEVDPRLRWEFIDVNGSGSVTLGPFGLDKEFDNGVELSGSISGKVIGNVTMFYDIHLFSASYFEASFSFTTEINGEVKAEISTESNDKEWKNVVFQVDTRKVTLPTPVTGLNIYIKPTAKVQWELKGEVSFNWTSTQTSGFKYNSDTGRTDIKKKENTVSVMAKGSAEAKIGPVIDIGVELLNGVLNGGVVAEAGAKVSAEAEVGFDDLLDNVDSKHACGLCVKGEAHWYAEATAKCAYKISEKWQGDIVSAKILEFTSPIKICGIINAKFFVSLINSIDSPFGGNFKMGGGDCTNQTYRTELKVKDENDQDVSGVSITVVREGQTYIKSGTSTYVVYLYAGIYNASAEIDGQNVSKKFVVSDDRQTVVLAPDTVNTILEGTVVDASDQNTVLSGVSVKIKQDDIVISSTETNSSGRFSISVPSGALDIEFYKEGYLPFNSAETVHSGDAIHSLGMVELTPGEGMGGFRGVLRDAVTNEPIFGAELNLYKGWNNPAEPNTAIRTLETNSRGEFRVDTVTLFGNVIGLPSGNYTLTASAEGYSDTSYNIVVYPGTTDSNPLINETMSPVMEEGYYRIVLTWGMYPRDLDSHLVAKTESESSIHVYYSDKNPYPNYANLDVDDTTSEGPETITITNFDGLHDIHYAVHDYTNRYSASSEEMSNSGAIVRLYKGNQLLRTFNVPTGYPGTEWDVFELKADGSIKTINTVKFTSSPTDVLSEFTTLSLTHTYKDYELAEMELMNEPDNESSDAQ